MDMSQSLSPFIIYEDTFIENRTYNPISTSVCIHFI